MDTKTNKRTQVTSFTDPAILVPAIGDAFKKLDPRLMIRNPVMFVVEIVATLVTVLFLRDLAIGAGHLGFAL
jgi:potassium-transporting ATPase ATP-binding subunit